MYCAIRNMAARNLFQLNHASYHEYIMLILYFIFIWYISYSHLHAVVYTVYRCCIFCGIFNFAKFYRTAQIFEGYKFYGFRCFPAKCKNYFCENEWMPIVTWLNYACKSQNLFSMKSKFWQIHKIIAHKIFALYGMFQAACTKV